MKSLFYLLLFLSFSCSASELTPFTSDGCSVFPDGTAEQQDLWLNCCIRHDLAYWKGGTQKEREEADRRLEACVKKLGKPEIAKIMHTGVRLGGTPWLPTTYRWGYGWPYLRGYAPLNKDELAQVKQQLYVLELMLKALREELDQ